jgi:Zn-dependent peptidase ImmA (M78 family)/DNA-binding XRE family transcriptional regulator
MKEIFCKRLKSARLLAKLTQEELAQKVGITKNAVSKYEKGEMMAETSVLKSLAEALGVGADYLLRPYEVELTNVEFRKKASMSPRDENIINEQILIRIENYLKTEEILSIPNTFENPFPGVVIHSKGEMEEYAGKLIGKWQLGINGIPSVYRMLEDHEVKIIELPFSKDFDGWSGLACGKYPVIVINANTPTTERKRFTALHELAHLIFSFDETLSEKEVEKLCHYFAGAVLVPLPSIKRMFGESRSFITSRDRMEVNRLYGISHQAFMYRALELGIIKPYTYTQFQIRMKGNRSEEGLSLYPLDEKTNRFGSLITRAITEELVTLGRASELSGIPVDELAESVS